MTALNIDTNTLIAAFRRSKPVAKNWRADRTLKHTMLYNQWYDTVYDIAMMLHKQEPNLNTHAFITDCHKIPLE